MTAVDALRQPICLLLAATGMICIAGTPLLVLHKFGEDGALARDGGLAFHFVFGLLLAGYAASNSLAGELRTGTASTVLSKPVARETLLCAKFLGVAGVVVLFSACAIATTLLAERVDEKFLSGPQSTGYITDWRTGLLLLAVPCIAILVAGLLNYRTGRPVGSVAFTFLLLGVLIVFVLSGWFDRLGRPAPFDFRVDWRILPAGVLVTLALLVFCALAVSLSTRAGAAFTIAFCIAIFLAGLMSDYLFGRHAAGAPAAALMYRILPNWQHFWLPDALDRGGRIPWSYVGRAAGYAGVYCLGVLGLGMASFRHVEVA